MLELRGVSGAGAFGPDPILSQASFRLSRDVPTALIGLTVGGRDALLRLLSGKDRPRTGSILLDGEEVGRARKTKGRIVSVDGTGVKPSGRRAAKCVGAETAARIGLSDRMDARTDQLDQEQRVRLAIGAARDVRPSLLLLDAPALQLAGDMRGRFLADLGTMLADPGAVVVLVAGLPDEALALGGDVLVLESGKVLQHGPAAEVFGRPLSLVVALVTSHPAPNTLAMAAREGRGALADGSTFQPPEGLAFPSSGACTLAFRPEETRFERRSPSCLRFVVRAVGEETVAGRRFARLRFADTEWLAPLPAESPPAGAMINAFIDPAHLMVFDESGKMIA
jgi:glycerol transport system ATP-binding protein